MFHRFREKTIKVIMLAQEESRSLGHNFVSSEQILLGLIGEGTGIAAQSLKSSGVTMHAARVAVEHVIGRGTESVELAIPFVDDAKHVLELSWEEAKRLGHNYIDTEHLLLGILRRSDCVALNVLKDLGVNLRDLENRIRESLRISGVENQEDETLSSGISKVMDARFEIDAWNNRAEMARKAGMPDLVEQSMEHKRRYEDELAKLLEAGEEKNIP